MSAYIYTSHGVDNVITYTIYPESSSSPHHPRGHGENTLLIYSISCAARSRIAWQPPPVTRRSLSFSDHTQSYAGYYYWSGEYSSSQLKSVLCTVHRKMNRPGRPRSLFGCVFAVCVVTAAWTLPPGVRCADDSLRTALEAISDKIGETPPRVVYLSPAGR